MKLNKILVVDIESTCWETPEEKARNTSEIIQVGFCFWDKQNDVIASPKSLYVRPKYSTISEYCTNLTGITQDIVDKAPHLEEVCKILTEKYNSQKFVWASFGYYDQKMFRLWTGGFYPFSESHVNVKIDFALKFNLKKPVGMAKALQIINEPLEGIHHNAADDSYNTAKILRKILS